MQYVLQKHMSSYVLQAFNQVLTQHAVVKMRSQCLLLVKFKTS